MRKNWSEFLDRLQDTAMLIDRFIQCVIGRFSSEEKAKEIEQFFKENPVAAAERTIQQSIEKCLANAKWLKTNRDEVAAWLEAQK